MRRTKNGQMSDLAGAQWQVDDLLATRSEVEQCRIAKGLGDQSNPKGQAAFAKAGRDGDCREIQQVDEVGIEPEIGVEALWLSGYGCDLVIGAGGGQQQNVDRREHAVDGAALCCQFVLRAIG